MDIASATSSKSIALQRRTLDLKLGNFFSVDPSSDLETNEIDPSCDLKR